MNQISEQELHQHVTIVAWLNIGINALLLLLGLCGGVILVSIGLIPAAEGDATAFGVLSIIALVAVLFFGVLALPGILAGYGLLRRERWGQILALIVAILSLFNFPVGTLIGAYTLFVLLQNSATAYFAPEAS
jgi:hypothetical protein